jgi:hypothetical protein
MVINVHLYKKFEIISVQQLRILITSYLEINLKWILAYIFCQLFNLLNFYHNNIDN